MAPKRQKSPSLALGRTESISRVESELRQRQKCQRNSSPSLGRHESLSRIEFEMRKTQLQNGKGELTRHTSMVQFSIPTSDGDDSNGLKSPSTLSRSISSLKNREASEVFLSEEVKEHTWTERNILYPLVEQWNGTRIQMFLVLLYYTIGAIVFCSVEEHDCYDQPPPEIYPIQYQVDGVLLKGTFTPDVSPCVQKWTLLDAIYFSTVTITTVGYGDLAPQTFTGRMFAIPYVLFGLSLIFSIINGNVMSHYENLHRKACCYLEGGNMTDSTFKQCAVKLALSTAILLLFVLFGGVVCHTLEGWSYSDGVWWSFITLTTIGYGDLTPLHVVSRIFSIVYILVAVVLGATAIGNLGTFLYEFRLARRERFLLNKQLSPEMISAFDLDGNGAPCKFQFVFGILQMLEIIDEDQVLKWAARFDELDVDKTGYLDASDMLVERLKTSMAEDKAKHSPAIHAENETIQEGNDAGPDGTEMESGLGSNGPAGLRLRTGRSREVAE